MTKSPVEFGLVCDNLDKQLCTSVDGITELEIDKVPFTVPQKSRHFHLKLVLRRQPILLKCLENNQHMYGDDVFQSLINTVGYRIQVLHHALVFKSRKVFFVTTRRNEVIYTTKQVKLYKVLLKIFLKAPVLDSFRIYRTFTDNQLSDESLATNG